METEARQIHGRAEQARERGEFLEALKLTDEALISYQQESDKIGFSEVLSSRSITLRLLFEQTAAKDYLLVAKHTAQSAVEIAELSGDTTALPLPYLELGKILQTLKDYKGAKEAFGKAIQAQERSPNTEHNRPAVLIDMKIHYHAMGCFLKEANALEQVESLIEKLKQTDEPQYNKDVWVSGGYMHLAEAVHSTDPEKAQKLMSQAKSIIDSNPELTIRKQQWEKLSSTLN